jgi:CO/xanthine dehydrogenase FAD-binding subunit
VQDERLVAVRLHLAGQVRLLLGGVDVRVPVVLEHAEEAVEPHVDARRLHHRLVVRLQQDAAEASSALMSRSESSTTGTLADRAILAPAARPAAPARV